MDLTQLLELFGATEFLPIIVAVLGFVLVVALILVWVVQSLKNLGWIGDGAAGKAVTVLNLVVVAATFFLTQLGQGDEVVKIEEVVANLIVAVTAFGGIQVFAKLWYELQKFVGAIVKK